MHKLNYRANYSENLTVFVANSVRNPGGHEAEHTSIRGQEGVKSTPTSQESDHILRMETK